MSCVRSCRVKSLLLLYYIIINYKKRTELTLLARNKRKNYHVICMHVYPISYLSLPKATNSHITPTSTCLPSHTLLLLATTTTTLHTAYTYYYDTLHLRLASTLRGLYRHICTTPLSLSLSSSRLPVAARSGLPAQISINHCRRPSRVRRRKRQPQSPSPCLCRLALLAQRAARRPPADPSRRRGWSARRGAAPSPRR